MKVIVVGPGAFGIKHLDGLKNINGAELFGLVGLDAEKTQAVADEYFIPNVYTSLEDALESDAPNWAMKALDILESSLAFQQFFV